VNADLCIQKGSVITYLGYDIGREVKLDLAARRIQEDVQRPQLAAERRQRQPKYFGYDPLPVRFSRRVRSIPLAGYQIDPEVECTLWDFGGLTLAYKIQLPAGTKFSALVELSAVLDETHALEAEAEELVDQIASQLGKALVSRHINDTVEDYIVFRIKDFNEPLSGSALRERYSLQLAQIVRCERARLAAGVVDETMEYRLSYKADETTGADSDLTVIGWNAAFSYDREEDAAPDDLCAVLEFALAYLLEMRLLDERLDDYLDEAYSVSLRRSRWFRADFSRIGLIQIDAAMLFEAVHNALKLIGDEYLAEVQRLAAHRFGFEELDKTLRRKLGTMQSIYEKLADRRVHRRAEVLESIIIFLILLELLLQ